MIRHLIWACLGFCLFVSCEGERSFKSNSKQVGIKEQNVPSFHLRALPSLPSIPSIAELIFPSDEGAYERPHSQASEDTNSPRHQNSNSNDPMPTVSHHYFKQVPNNHNNYDNKKNQYDGRQSISSNIQRRIANQQQDNASPSYRSHSRDFSELGFDGLHQQSQRDNYNQPPDDNNQQNGRKGQESSRDESVFRKIPGSMNTLIQMDKSFLDHLHVAPAQQHQQPVSQQSQPPPRHPNQPLSETGFIPSYPPPLRYHQNQHQANSRTRTRSVPLDNRKDSPAMRPGPPYKLPPHRGQNNQKSEEDEDYESSEEDSRNHEEDSRNQGERDYYGDESRKPKSIEAESNDDDDEGYPFDNDEEYNYGSSNDEPTEKVKRTKTKEQSNKDKEESKEDSSDALDLVDQDYYGPEQGGKFYNDEPRRNYKPYNDPRIHAERRADRARMPKTRNKKMIRMKRGINVMSAADSSFDQDETPTLLYEKHSPSKNPLHRKVFRVYQSGNNTILKNARLSYGKDGSLKMITVESSNIDGGL